MSRIWIFSDLRVFCANFLVKKCTSANLYAFCMSECLHTNLHFLAMHIILFALLSKKRKYLWFILQRAKKCKNTHILAVIFALHKNTANICEKISKAQKFAVAFAESKNTAKNIAKTNQKNLWQSQIFAIYFAYCKIFRKY